MFRDKKICRTCLTNEKELLSICALINDDSRIIDYFNECLRISVKNNDNLPQTICLSCLDSLLEVKKFYQQCINSENYLKEQQQQINTNSNSIGSDDENDDINETYEFEMIETSNGSNQIIETATGENQDLLLENYYCIECNESFKYEKNYKLHLKIEHGEKSDKFTEIIRTEQDDEQENTKFAEKKVQNSNKDMKKFHCELCECSFKFRSNFVYHMKRHKSRRENMSKCPYSGCEKEFYTTKTLHDHVSKVHFADDESLLCPYCGIKVDSKNELKRHLSRMHTKVVKKYKCQFCDKLFLHKEHLITHERVHTDERPYKCEYCGKAFKQSSTLKTHITLHTGKPIKCKICSKRFSRNGFLTVHMRMHTDERPYACDFCPQRYTQKCHLKSHLAVHSNERPFVCNVCYMTFAKKEILRNHRYIHAPKPYKCPECSLETASVFWFRKHLKRAHNIEGEDITKYKRKIIIEDSSSGSNELMYSIITQENEEEIHKDNENKTLEC